MATTPDPQPIVSGVPDTREVPLHQLAGQAEKNLGALRRVLPDNEDQRVAVAAFNSSI